MNHPANIDPNRIPDDLLAELYPEDPPPTVRARLLRRVGQAATASRIAAAHGVGAAGVLFDVLPNVHWNGEPIATHRPVVIVGGYGSRPEFYRLLARSYREAGIGSVHIVPLIENAYSDIRENILRLENIIDGLGCDVDIVGHSEGGLIARGFVKFRNAADRVPHVVTICSPNQGLTFDRLDPVRLVKSPVARRASQVARQRLAPLIELLSSVALQQMLAGSEFMRELNATPATPEPTQWLSISSRHDGVVPFATMDLPDAANVTNVTMETTWRNGNHAAIATTNEEAFRTTLSFLSHGRDQ